MTNHEIVFGHEYIPGNKIGDAYPPSVQVGEIMYINMLCSICNKNELPSTNDMLIRILEKLVC